jgi:hypothetical protein
MDAIPAVIFGIILIIYGIIVFNGKLLRFLIAYKHRVKEAENSDRHRGVTP